MQNKKTQMSVGSIIQRCHKLRQKRKQCIDQARQTLDEIEKERLLQVAEHYGRIVSEEQVKINLSKDKTEEVISESEEESDNDLEEDK